jgi:phosphonoacetate hydrolase
MPARQRAVVAMIDGLDPAYVTDETMPVLGRLAAEGTSRVVQAVMPTRPARRVEQRPGSG